MEQVQEVMLGCRCAELQIARNDLSLVCVYTPANIYVAWLSYYDTCGQQWDQ